MRISFASLTQIIPGGAPKLNGWLCQPASSSVGKALPDIWWRDHSLWAFLGCFFFCLRTWSLIHYAQNSRGKEKWHCIVFHSGYKLCLAAAQILLLGYSCDAPASVPCYHCQQWYQVAQFVCWNPSRAPLSLAVRRREIIIRHLKFMTSSAPLYSCQHEFIHLLFLLFFCFQSWLESSPLIRQARPTKPLFSSQPSLTLCKVQCFLIPGVTRGPVLINERFGIVNAAMCDSAGVAFSTQLPVH